MFKVKVYPQKEVISFINIVYFKLVQESIFLTSNSDETYWPNAEGTFTDLEAYIDYFVNGDPTNDTKNPNVAFASNFGQFKSTFGPGKSQITNNQNTILNQYRIAILIHIIIIYQNIS